MKQGTHQSIGLVAALAGMFTAARGSQSAKKNKLTLPPSLCAPASSPMPFSYSRPQPGWRAEQSKRRHKEIQRRRRANA